MAAIPGRDMLVKYDSGSGAVAIAGCQSDSLSITKEPIDITDKSDNGIRTLLDAIGTFSMDGTISGILKGTTLIDLANSTADDAQLHDFEIELVGVGTWSGSFFIGTLEIGGEDGASAVTFSAPIMSSGAITWTAV